MTVPSVVVGDDRESWLGIGTASSIDASCDEFNAVKATGWCSVYAPEG